MHAKSPLLVQPTQTTSTGVVVAVTPQQAGWSLLDVKVLRLKPGDTHYLSTANSELGCVILHGRVECSVNGENPETLGRRTSVFEDKPYALYLSTNMEARLNALDDVEIAICSVPATVKYPYAIVRPEDCAVELRGGDNASRQIVSVFPPGFPCEKIVCVEVYTPSGNWSSYPPHKHDRHTVGPDGSLVEADLEETYFYRFDRPDGFAYQRVYTADKRLDELVRATDYSIVLVPEGYHPVASGVGSTTYYLNFLAGSAQSLANTDDPEYAWIKSTLGPIDARLPIVPRT
ncbi:MAG: 5-deoxy-glucuronate isomerase [Chloroflexi bacterium]|nr:5-deoxy-glucuronate isomerase [Chloroflexota bacterium]